MANCARCSVGHYPSRISTNGPGKVLDLLLSSILKRSFNLAFKFTKNLVTDQYATGLSKRFEACRYVHALSVHISALLNDDITKVEADAQLERTARQLCLDRQSTPHRRYRAREFCEKPVTRGLHEPASVLLIFGSITFCRSSCT